MNVINEIEKDLPAVSSIPDSGVDTVPQRAAQEINFWKGLTETESSARPRLSQMWSNAGWEENDWTPSGTPWSAAFISWLLRDDSNFTPSASHYGYTEKIISGQSPGWTAYSIPKNLGILRLSPGDILIKPRGAGGAPGQSAHYKTHGDIISTLSNNQAVLVGGNVGNTARVVGRINIDSQGKPTQSLEPYVVILKREKKSSKLIFSLGALLMVVGGFLWSKRKK